MGLADQQTQQKFPFPYDDVFDSLLVILPKNWNWTLKSQDRLIGRLTVSTNVSLFSYGENITIKLDKVDEANTLVTIESSLKVGMNIAAAHRHAKNFDSIISELSHYLQYEKGKPVSETERLNASPELVTNAQATEQAGKAKTVPWLWIGSGALSICLLVAALLLVQSKDRSKQTWMKPNVPMTVSFSPSNEVAIGADKKIEIVDAQTGAVKRKFDFPLSNVRSIAFSPDGSLMAVGGGQTFGDGNFTIWNFQSNQIVRTAQLGKEVDCVSFSPNSQFLAFTASDNLVHLLNLQTGVLEELSGHSQEVVSVAFVRQGNLLVSGASDSIKIWNLQTKKIIRELTDCSGKFASSSDGKLLSVSGRQLGTVKLFDINTGELRRILSWPAPDKYEIRGFAFLENSKLLAVGGGQDFAKPGEIRIFDTVTGSIKYLFNGHQGLVLDLAVSPQESLLVSTGAVVKDSYTVYGEVKTWDISKLSE